MLVEDVDMNAKDLEDYLLKIGSEAANTAFIAPKYAQLPGVLSLKRSSYETQIKVDQALNSIILKAKI